MIFYVCADLQCKTLLRVMGQDVDTVRTLVGDRSEWWSDRFMCPTCSGPATGFFEGSVDPSPLSDYKLIDLEAEDYFRFLMGVGLPEERLCTLLDIQEVLLRSHVKKVEGKGIPGTSRATIEWLELEDGTRVYFGASAHGASVYKIVNKPQYAKRVLADVP